MSAIWTPPKLYEGNEQRDFVQRFEYAEVIKQEMRRKYSLSTRRKRGVKETFDDCSRRMREFYEQYEEVNLNYIPEDPVFSKATTGLTTSNTNDVWEIGAAANGQLRVLESFVGGENVASTVGRLLVARVTVQGTGTAPTTYAPEKFNSRSPGANSTVYGGISAQVAWATTQPTVNANPLIVHGLNTFGGSDRWVAQPGEEIYCVNAEFITLRAASTTPIVSCYVVFEEL
jgi:hypothetical protein